MVITTRDLTPADADRIAELMSRVEADHPTGFCLGAGEVVELMVDKPGTVFEGAFDARAERRRTNRQDFHHLDEQASG